MRYSLIVSVFLILSGTCGFSLAADGKIITLLFSFNFQVIMIAAGKEKNNSPRVEEKIEFVLNNIRKFTVS